MIKKTTLLLCISSFLAATANDKDKEFRRKKIVVLGSAVVVGIGLGVASVALPVIFPGGVLLGLKGVATGALAKATVTGVAVKTTATAAAVKTSGAIVAVAPYATTVGLGISAVQVAKPFVLPTPEDELNNILKAKAARVLKAQTELTECLTKNKFTLEKDAVNPPPTCEHQARVFKIMSGRSAFNN